jgi:hypothetical protein
VSPKTPRKRNKAGTVPLTLRTTPGVLAYLDRLVERELYGKNRSAVAEQLLREALRRIYSDPVIAGSPPEPEP